MHITRGYRTELDLNHKQITACKKHAGAARYAWNWGLHRKQEVYQQTRRSISAMELHRELNKLKQTELPWMYEVSKCAPQEALRDLDTAFRNFFRRVDEKKAGTRKGKQSKSHEPSPLPEHITRKVKEKQIKKLLRQATPADVALRPLLVILEDLNVDGMKRNHKLALAISDVGLGEFKRQMTYKTAWQGESLCLADRWYPSTKMCSGCGHIKEDMDLSERVYVCDNPQCLLVIERDLNAALNLGELARKVAALAKHDPTCSLESLFHEVMRKAMKAAKHFNPSTS